MTYAILPLTNDPWQVFTADVLLDGEPFHAQISVRCFRRHGAAADRRPAVGEDNTV